MIEALLTTMSSLEYFANADAKKAERKSEVYASYTFPTCHSFHDVFLDTMGFSQSMH